MTAKDKAKELYEKYCNMNSHCDNAKECALIAIDEIIKSGPRYPNEVDWDDAGGAHQYYYEAQREEADKYWKEVKQEIEKL